MTANDIIYSPHDRGMAGFRAAKRASEFKDIAIPLRVRGSEISDYFAPLLPWEICAIQAQTHNGKTMFGNWWERDVIAYLNEQGQEGDIVHVSHEESIEAMAFTEYGRLLDVLPAKLARGEFADIGKLEIAMKQIDACRIWSIAESADRPEDETDLTISNVYRALLAMQEGKIAEARKIRLVTWDYLQANPIDLEVKQTAADAQRRLQVRNDVYRLRKMTVHLKTPILIMVQCKQDLKGNNPPYEIPGIYDGEETSSIAQRFDRIISLWMPKTSKPPMTVVTYNGTPVFTVAENQVFAKVNKQRGGLPSGQTFELKIDYSTYEYMDAYTKESSHA